MTYTAASIVNLWTSITDARCRCSIGFIFTRSKKHSIFIAQYFYTDLWDFAVKLDKQIDTWQNAHTESITLDKTWFRKSKYLSSKYCNCEAKHR